MNQNANVGMNAINAANATNEAISSPSPSNIEGKGGAATPVVVKPKKGDDVSIRYRGLTYEMAVELHLAEQQYFFWDLPVPFGEKLKLYPVNVIMMILWTRCHAYYWTKSNSLPTLNPKILRNSLK